MLSLLMIEERETEVTGWLEQLVAAGSAVGVELERLYGPTEKTEAEVTLPELDLSRATVNGVPIDQWMNDPAQSILRNQEVARDGADQAATAPPSDPNDNENPEPESGVRPK